MFGNGALCDHHGHFIETEAIMIDLIWTGPYAIGD